MTIHAQQWTPEHTAEQQSTWADPEKLTQVSRWLQQQKELVTPKEVASLRQQMNDVSRGNKMFFQAGDCVEPYNEFDDTSITKKIKFINELATMLAYADNTSVVKVGRIVGQFAKPRSNGYEIVEGHKLPVFRGEIVNGYEATEESRTPNPSRMYEAYKLSKHAMHLLAHTQPEKSRVWTSHEALILDYEAAFVRQNPITGKHYLGTTHLPWVGERTRGINGAHIELLQKVNNTVAVKIGPHMTGNGLKALCESLNPHQEDGRLVLIFRLGVAAAKKYSSLLLKELQQHSKNTMIVIDPMHGNTQRAQIGRKTRSLNDIENEMRIFASAARANSARIHGIHLEATPYDVTECVGLGVSEDDLLRRTYTTLCDPRLNAEQAMHIVQVFRESL